MIKQSFMNFLKTCYRFISTPTFICVVLFQLLATSLHSITDDYTIITGLLISSFVFFVSIVFFGYKKWIVKIISKINVWSIPIELISFEGRHYYTFAKYNKSSSLEASVYWHVKVGQVLLKDDGTIDKTSESSYIYWWLPLNNPLRAEYILKNDYPDFSRLEKYVD